MDVQVSWTCFEYAETKHTSVSGKPDLNQICKKYVIINKKYACPQVVLNAVSGPSA